MQHQQEEELAAERRAVEAEVRARLQEEWAAKGEARMRRTGKQVGVLDGHDRKVPGLRE